jgi:DNA-binding IclR family transcriptional regulator
MLIACAGARALSNAAQEIRMARPALSASRSVDVLDLLAAFPGRSFTLSEIARATGVNVASCHAVLSTLVERGYLSRAAGQRTYALGPALVALGEAALKAQPLVARAKAAAHELHGETDAPVLLSAIVGEEIVGLVSLADAGGRGPGLRVGERRPLVPPVGASFLAWSPEAETEAWIARSAGPYHDRLAEECRRSLALTRQRGYQVTLRSTEGREISALMAEMASGRRAPESRDGVTRLINSLDLHLAQPETLEPDTLYDVVLIAAPIFDQSGRAAFSLCFGGFAERLSGATVLAHADRLVRTCVQVMREDREAA